MTLDENEGKNKEKAENKVEAGEDMVKVIVTYVIYSVAFFRNT
jgi:hypothetical protein